jgi:hypothetical protein
MKTRQCAVDLVTREHNPSGTLTTVEWSRSPESNKGEKDFLWTKEREYEYYSVPYRIRIT